MTSSGMDTGMMELDKLIHSFEFENQQYVKMIDKENQLIMSLEYQIRDRIQETARLEEEVSRFDKDTKRLHKLYTNNRDNIANLKSTINVLSDHEMALSRQLEVTRTKTEENRKFYETHIANYSSIRDDYMKKYRSFPLAIELENKLHDLAAAQRKLDDIKAVKQDLKDRIAAKENELDRKVMTRIVVNIAKTKLDTYRLEKDIHECLTEKADLVEKLKDIRTSKQPEQGVQSAQETEGSRDKLNMETDEVISEQLDGCDGETTSGETEGLSQVCITDGPQKSFTSDDQDGMPSCIVDELCMKNSDDRHCPSEIANTAPGGMHPEMNVGTCKVWSILAHQDGHDQLTFRDRDSPSRDLNNAPAIYHRDGNEVVARQLSATSYTQTSVAIPATAGNKPFQSTTSEDHVPTLVMSSLGNITSALPRKRDVLMTPLKQEGACQPLVQQSAQTTVCTDNSETPMPPSLRVPRLSVPKPPRVLPPPPIRISSKPHEQRNPPEVFAEIKQPPAPSSNLLMDFRQKLSLCVPRPPQHSSYQQNQLNTLPKTPTTMTTMTVHGQPEHGPRTHQFNITQVPQLQTRPSSYSAVTMLPQKVHNIMLPTNQHKPTTEETSVGKLTASTSEWTVKKQTESSVQLSATASVEKTDFEVPISGGDVTAGRSGNCQSLFKVNIKGPHSTAADTKLPKGMYSKPSSHEKSSASQGGHGFLFESLFGNFEKSSNEDGDENDSEAAPTSIFSLFNISQNPSTETAGEDSTDAEPIFTFGKFTYETGSPSSNGGPCNLLHLFTKSQNSESSNHEFPINLEGDGDQDDDKENERTTFKLGAGGEGSKESYFSYGSRCESDEERDKPLFNLF